jgi:acetylornithine deacetylase
MKATNLLLELLKIPSISGDEKKIAEFIATRLSKNFKIKKQIVDKNKGNFNILAYVGKPNVILNAHLDTVKDFLKVKQDSFRIYGRGACDTKASVASMIIAAEELIEQGATNFGLLFDVEEETSFNGIKKALSIIPSSVKYIVVGEPTNSELVYGQKGIIDLKISCRGKAAHGSTPEKGINAIELLINELNTLKNLKFREDGTLGNNTLNIGLISGGKAGNIVVDYAEARAVIRNSVKSKFLIKLIKKKLCNSKITMKFLEPVLFKDLVNISSKLNLKSKVVPYFTEMYFLSKKAKTFVFGPGDGNFAHSLDEQILKKELEASVLKYKQIITFLNNKSLLKTNKEEVKDGI